jgi:orotate phosphoribosyltransferase
MSNLPIKLKKILEDSGALKQGHFILSSGKHSEYYVQCSLIMSQPYFANVICTSLVKKIRENIDINSINKIVSPAMGGILLGYEIARQCKLENIFLERVNGTFSLRRGFHISDKDNILVIEDVLTTGKSSLETYELIQKYGGNIIAEACIIRRNPKIDSLNNIPIISLLDLDFPCFDSKNIPDHLKMITAEKPGSRFIKK